MTGKKKRRGDDVSPYVSAVSSTSEGAILIPANIATITARMMKMLLRALIATVGRLGHVGPSPAAALHMPPATAPCVSHKYETLPLDTAQTEMIPKPTAGIVGAVKAVATIHVRKDMRRGAMRVRVIIRASSSTLLIVLVCLLDIDRLRCARLRDSRQPMQHLLDVVSSTLKYPRIGFRETRSPAWTLIATGMARPPRRVLSTARILFPSALRVA
jgi:hypothetical protein